MTNIVEFDSPLTRMVGEMKATIAEQAAELDELRAQAASVYATRDLLRLLLADMETKAMCLAEEVALVIRNVAALRAKLRHDTP